MKKLGILVLALLVAGVVGHDVSYSYPIKDEVATVEVLPSICVEPVANEFDTRLLARVRIVISNPTANEYRLSEEGFELTDQDFLWAHVELSGAAVAYPKADYEPILHRLGKEVDILEYEYSNSYSRLLPHSVKTFEVPMTMFARAESFKPGYHVLNYSARFHYRLETDRHSVKHPLNTTGTIRFAILN